MKDTQESITDKSRFVRLKIFECDRVLRCEVKIDEYDKEFFEIDFDIKGVTHKELDYLTELIEVFEVNAVINYIKSNNELHERLYYGFWHLLNHGKWMD